MCVHIPTRQKATNSFWKEKTGCCIRKIHSENRDVNSKERILHKKNKIASFFTLPIVAYASIQQQSHNNWRNTGSKTRRETQINMKSKEEWRSPLNFRNHTANESKPQKVSTFRKIRDLDKEEDRNETSAQNRPGRSRVRQRNVKRI